MLGMGYLHTNFCSERSQSTQTTQSVIIALGCCIKLILSQFWKHYPIAGHRKINLKLTKTLCPYWLTYIISFHGSKRCYSEKMYQWFYPVGGPYLLQHWPARQVCGHWCKSGMMFIWVTNSFLIECEACSMGEGGGDCAWYSNAS